MTKLLSLWCLAMVIGLYEASDSRCPVDDNSVTLHLPHPTDCSKYLRCDHEDIITQDCPDGLHFNANLQVCDWPLLAGCQSIKKDTTDQTEILPNGCPAIDPTEYTVHKPHQTNCSLFYKCDHGDLVLFECPAGLHFNPVLHVCDWPAVAGCQANTGLPSSSTTSKPPTEGTTTPSVILPNGCPAVDPMNYTVHFPHPSNCSLFYKCDHGDLVLFECPAGLHFNPVLHVCDWPANAGCEAVSNGCPGFVGNEPLPNPVDCSSYLVCVNNDIVTIDCPEDKNFDVELLVCDWACHANCGDKSLSLATGGCPAVDPTDHSVLLPNPEDCSSYFICDNGQPILTFCPPGLNYNSNLQVCDWPWIVKCDAVYIPS